MLILILVRFIFVLIADFQDRGAENCQHGMMTEPREGTGHNPELDHRPRDYIRYRAERSPRLDHRGMTLRDMIPRYTTAQVSPDGRIVSGRGS